MRPALFLVAIAGAALGLEVHEPAYAAGVYAETRAGFSPRGYKRSGSISVVDACPCDWITNMADFGPGSFVGLILAVPGDACTECTAVQAACAAKQACKRQEAYACSEAGLLLPEGFGESVGDSSDKCEDTDADDDSPLPTAFISVNASAALVNATIWSTDTVNATMADPDGDAYDCTPLENVPFIYLGFVLVWFVAFVLWAWNNLRNLAHTRELHWRLAFLPFIGLVQAGLSVIFYAYCPWEASPFIVALQLCWVLASIVKEPVVILCFVLVSKGWGTTREELSRCDSWRIGACITAMFMSMAVGMAVQTRYGVLATVALYLIIYVEVFFSIKTNLLILKAQLCALRHFSVDPRSTPVYHKYFMFRRLSWLAAGYVIVEISLHISFEFTGRFGGVWWPFFLTHQASELLFALCIGYTFRATPRNVLFQPVQPQVTELADRLLPQITTVEIGPELLGEGGSDLLPWRQDMQLASAAPQAGVVGSAAAGQDEPPPTLLIINPGDTAFDTTPPGRHEIGKPPARAQVAPAPSPSLQQHTPQMSA